MVSCDLNAKKRGDIFGLVALKHGSSSVNLIGSTNSGRDSNRMDGGKLHSVQRRIHCAHSAIQVIVKIPEDKNILRLIHKTIEFVVREGAAFETIILSREFHNPLFRFMVDFLSPEVWLVLVAVVTVHRQDRVRTDLNVWMAVSLTSF